MHFPSKHKIADYIIFLILLIPIAYANWYLFFRQSVRLDDMFHSDMYAYTVYIEGIDLGLRFPYPVLFFTAKVIYKVLFRHHFLGPELGMAISTLIFELLAIIASKITLDYLLEDKIKSSLPNKFNALSGLFLSFIAIAVNYLSMLFLEGRFLFGWGHRYMGVYTPNVWHNSTYIAVKPFAIFTFYAFSLLIDKIKLEKDRFLDYLFFSVCLMVVTLTKPSYTIVFGIAAGLISLINFIRKDKFKKLIALFVSVIPTLIVLVYQYIDVFNHTRDTVDGGIGIGFCSVWSQKIQNIPVAIIMACFFPFISLILNFKRYKNDTSFILSWLQYLFGLLMFLFLYEKGFRMQDANFSWGYCHGLFFVFFNSTVMLIKDSFSLTKRSGLKKIIPVIILWAAFLMHLINGISYYVGLMQGELYI